MRNVSVKVRLIISFLLIVFISTSCLGFVSYNVAKKEVMEQILYSGQESNKTLNTFVNGVIYPQVKNIEFLAQNINSAEVGTEGLRQRLNDFQSAHSELINAFVGNENGSYVNAPNVKMPDGYDPRKRPWYKQAMENKGEVIITNPYQSVSVDAVVVTIAKTTKDGKGVVGIDLNLNHLTDEVKKVRIGKEGYAFILDEQGEVIVHPHEKYGSKVSGVQYEEIMKQNSGELTYMEGEEQMNAVFSVNPLTGWKIASVMPESEAEQEVAPIFYTTLVVVLVFFVFSLLLAYIVIRSITQPLQDLRNVAEKVKEGDLTSKVQSKGRDELSVVGTSFNHMIDSLHSVLQTISEKSHLLASSSEQLAASAEQSSQASEHVAAMTQDITEETIQQTKSIEKASLSVDEMSRGIQQIAGNSQTVSLASSEALERTEKGKQALQTINENMSMITDKVGELSKVIECLSERSNQIGKIVEVITEIANQTNLLSLNAAIEAARAGEQGKGFAVVADEVRSLAEQSSNSAEKIKALIATIQQEMKYAVQSMTDSTDVVHKGMKNVREADEAFRSILQSITEVTTQVQEVSAAVQQISAGAEEVMQITKNAKYSQEQNMEKMSSISSAMEEQLASMEEIYSSAAALSTIAEELRDNVDRFKM
ncbi:methyl-accepting chemotaxis protein [Aneurinibacillus thermoaerophilus]|uniref:methyl-accepting chemotaxis protein n=1 Tax=Aneurinibacillus thermoaerophilus TaxID=143495 RepID=UPI002E20AE26|nr:methyl-accepting chemotaxis protein [Aneurinibacillus thermoaerophilus]MED0755940.1 methyl-accepting chemotaxis protein [Aneurinibacillus thermoaerophilus]MED0759736.1 methyl-accepting chemotaxis protein [Aneurinibacillus thermoaerophilus]